MPSVDPQLLRLELHPDEGDLFVHGEVFSGEVTVVVVSLEDARGRLDTKSARIATGSTAFRIGANARFDVRFEIPDLSRDEGLWVRANAYDEDGTPVASSRQAISTTVAGG